jgi:hypothetical protein
MVLGEIGMGTLCAVEAEFGRGFEYFVRGGVGIGVGDGGGGAEVGG